MDKLIDFEARLGPEVKIPDYAYVVDVVKKFLNAACTEKFSSEALVKLLYPQKGIVQQRIYTALFKQKPQLLGYWTQGEPVKNSFGKEVRRLTWHAFSEAAVTKANMGKLIKCPCCGNSFIPQ